MKKSEIIKGLKVGNADLNGNSISRIFSKGDQFIIYEIETNVVGDSLKVLINPESDDDYEYLERNYEAVKYELNNAKVELFKTKRPVAMKNLLSAALSLGINALENESKTENGSNCDESKKLLNEVRDRIQNEYKDAFRNKLLYVFTTVFIVLGATVLAYFTCEFEFDCFDNASYVPQLIYCFAAATVGGFLALVFKLRKVNTDPDIGWYNFIFYGVERSLISIASSCLAV